MIRVSGDSTVPAQLPCKGEIASTRIIQESYGCPVESSANYQTPCKPHGSLPPTPLGRDGDLALQVSILLALRVCKVASETSVPAEVKTVDQL